MTYAYPTHPKGPLVINFFGGPGCGKSTAAAGLFYKLKLDGVKVELVQEYAKDLTWEKRYGALENQAYVFAKQLQRLHRIRHQVDVVVTDSPLLLSLLYLPPGYPKTFKPFVLEMVDGMNNMNVLLQRVKPYQQYGRNQTELQARDIDDATLSLLDSIGADYRVANGDETAVTQAKAWFDASEHKQKWVRPPGAL